MIFRLLVAVEYFMKKKRVKKISNAYSEVYLACLPTTGNLQIERESWEIFVVQEKGRKKKLSC